MGLWNWNVSRSMVLISGLTTAVGSSTMRANSGSSQPWKHSPEKRRGLEIDQSGRLQIDDDRRTPTRLLSSFKLHPATHLTTQCQIPPNCCFRYRCTINTWKLLTSQQWWVFFNRSEEVVLWDKWSETFWGCVPSQCASRKVRTSPWATLAPSSLAVIRPFLSGCLTTRTILNRRTNSSSCSFRWSTERKKKKVF